MKKQKNRVSGRYRWAVGCICTAVTIIVALNVFYTLCTSVEFANRCFHRYSVSAPVTKEDAFLSTALSLIGIAISVWAVLNIINVLDKKDVEALQEQLHQLQSESETVTAMQHRNALFQVFEQCTCDLGMKCLSQRLSMISGLPYAQLSLVMLHFKRVYDLHQRNQNATAVFAVASGEGIEYIDTLLQQEEFTSNKDVRMFLHYCLAEIYFYRTYASKDVSSYLDAQKALQEYHEAMPLFGVKLPAYGARKMADYPEKFPYDEQYGDNNALRAYLCNTVGECHSKLLQAERPANVSDEIIFSHRKAAIFYCEYAVRLSNMKNEKYLRNLGCALEAAYPHPEYINNEMICKRIWETYDAAMDVSIQNNEIPYRVFYVWLSFYYKCVHHTHAAREYDDVEIHTPVLQRMANEYSDRALVYASLAYMRYADKMVYKKHYALALRDLCLREQINGNNDAARKYYTEFARVGNELKTIYRIQDENEDRGKMDDYLAEICNDLCRLKTYFS